MYDATVTNDCKKSKTKKVHKVPGGNVVFSDGVPTSVHDINIRHETNERPETNTENHPHIESVPSNGTKRLRTMQMGALFLLVVEPDR